MRTNSELEVITCIIIVNEMLSTRKFALSSEVLFNSYLRRSVHLIPKSANIGCHFDI